MVGFQSHENFFAKSPIDLLSCLMRSLAATTHELRESGQTTTASSGIDSGPASLDEAMVQAIKGESSDAAIAFVDAHRRRLASLARRNGVPHPDSEDVAQDTLVGALLHIRSNRFRGESSLKVWLDGILKRRAARYWRDRRPSGVTVVSIEDQDREDIAPAVRSAEAEFLLQQALQQLPLNQIEIMLLNGLGGYSTSEIAHKLSRSPGRVGALLAEAKSRMRVTLTPSVAGSFRRRRPMAGTTLLSHYCEKHDLSWTSTATLSSTCAIPASQIAFQPGPSLSTKHRST